MPNIKIALHQFNASVGDIDANIQKILTSIMIAKNEGCDLFVTSELAITGYPPQDLLFRDGFYNSQQKALEKLFTVNDITIVCGVYFCPKDDYIADDIDHGYMQNQYDRISKIYNSAMVIRDGQILQRYDKRLLPNYEVFDECRYFYPGAKSIVFDCNGVKIGIVICEDMWHQGPIKAAVHSGAEIICILNASPYDCKKHKKRLESAKKRVLENNLPLVYVNQVGGQDELIFDGASFALDNKASLVLQVPAFEEKIGYINYSDLIDGDACRRDGEDPDENVKDNGISCYPDKIPGMYNALVLALKDYVNKNGFKGVVLGLSGGVDSALTLAIAFDALGADRVMAVMMPSKYTADISNIDAREMVDILKVKSTVIPIENIFTTFKNELNETLSNVSEVNANDTTFENLQARSRGVILMAISNRLGYLVVTTGNKSEMATGYATLYGDMAGGFAILKDVTKTNVYALSWYRNSKSYIIPERIITRAPSAELRENQTDQDLLPEYAVLDKILDMLVEDNLSVDEIIKCGFKMEDVVLVGHLLKISEHKRSQAAIGPKVTTRSFGQDWRMPISNKFKF